MTRRGWSEEAQMTGSYNLRFDDGQHWCVPTAAVEAFRDRCLAGRPRFKSFADRTSLCLWLDLLVTSERYGVAPEEMLQPILDLEGGEVGGGLKPATRFHRPPLRGLWHKHWFSARFLAANLLASMKRGHPATWLSEIVPEGELLTREMVGRIAERFTTTAFEERSASKQITGEWIIFVKRNGLSHYLCLATHGTGDQRIHDKIINVCSRDYPEIATWLVDASVQMDGGGG